MRTQSLPNRSLHYCIHGTLVGKLNFGFGRMNIYVNIARVNFQEKHIKRIRFGLKQTLVCP